MLWLDYLSIKQISNLFSCFLLSFKSFSLHSHSYLTSFLSTHSLSSSLFFTFTSFSSTSFYSHSIIPNQNTLSQSPFTTITLQSTLSIFPFHSFIHSSQLSPSPLSCCLCKRWIHLLITIHHPFNIHLITLNSLIWSNTITHHNIIHYSTDITLLSLINLSIIHHLHLFFFWCVFEMIEEMSRIQIRFVNNRLNPIEQSWIEWEYKCGNTSQSHKGRINELTLIETMCVKRSKCLIINNELIRIWYNNYDFIHYLQINWFFKILKIVCCESDSFCSVHSISWFYGVIGLSAIYSSLSFINFYIHSFIIMQLWIMTMIQLNSYYILPDSESLLSISLVFSWLQNGIIFLIKCLWRIIPDRNEECGYNHLRMEIERELDGVFELKEN